MCLEHTCVGKKLVRFEALAQETSPQGRRRLASRSRVRDSQENELSDVRLVNLTALIEFIGEIALLFVSPLSATNKRAAQRLLLLFGADKGI